MPKRKQRTIKLKSNQKRRKHITGFTRVCVCVCAPPKDTVMQLIMPRRQRTAPQIMHKIELSITLPTIATIISLWPQQFTKQTGEGGEGRGGREGSKGYPQCRATYYWLVWLMLPTGFLSSRMLHLVRIPIVTPPGNMQMQFRCGPCHGFYPRL